jgi:uncharacterized iron-regulated protein
MSSCSNTATRFLLLGIALALSTAACAPRARLATVSPVSVPGLRVVDAATGRDSDFRSLAERAGGMENHDDSETHRVEFGLLDALGSTGRPIVLSLEMFERDVQTLLSDYVAGRISETDFLARSRPWDRYVTDYRPMVELAKERGWPVIASNIPRPMASAVGRKGLAALDTLTAAERAWAARDIQCDTLPTAVATRFYLAQCIKDETMAESIVEARRRWPNALIVHYDGAFHSDFRLGTVSRVQRRLPDLKALVITAVPVVDQGTATLATHGGRADYIIFTKRIPPKTPPRP